MSQKYLIKKHLDVDLSVFQLNQPLHILYALKNILF